MIALLGSTGYVGSAYVRYFQQLGIPYVCLDDYRISYGDAMSLARKIKGFNATFLINAAGYTGKPNVDACEDQKYQCLFGNTILPGLVQEACKEADIPWGHVSSGCIYRGKSVFGQPFVEVDPPNFTFRSTTHGSWYSGTKALAEEILTNDPNIYIWRLRIPFESSDSPRNYLSKLLTYDRLLDADNSLSQLDEFVRATYECWVRHVPFGIYNVTNPGSITAREIIALWQKKGLKRDRPFRFFTSEAEFALSVRAPRSNCVLSSAKLLSTGIQLTEVRDAIEQAIDRWQTRTGYI